MGLDVIAIDGPAGAGKSTVARLVAGQLGWRYLDSGAMYRAVTCVALDRGVGVDDEAALKKLVETLAFRFELTEDGAPQVCVNGEDLTGRLRAPEVTASVTHVADSPAVRAALRSIQQREGAAGRVIMDGRDIGTYVFPDANHKFYLDAALHTRAQRRLQNIVDAGHPASLAQVEADVQRRDKDDRARVIAPLDEARNAPDVVVIDTTDLTIGQVVARVLEHMRA